jgi:hypothetical protein
MKAFIFKQNNEFIGRFEIAAQGRILKATLDTAANTSPNLDEEERAHLMSITPGE